MVRRKQRAGKCWVEGLGRGGFIEKVTFEHRDGGSESEYVNICQKGTLNRGGSTCQGPEAGVGGVLRERGGG